jgi:dihydrofolate reductase
VLLLLLVRLLLGMLCRLVVQAAADEVLDEYRLVILPVALGSGLPLFKDLAKPLEVDLAEAKSFPDGTVIHVYRR